MTAPTKTYTATEEHLSALESDYMTKATISLITNDIRNTPEQTQIVVTVVAAPGETRDALLEAYAALLKIDGRDGGCLLYNRIGNFDFCQSGCPFNTSDGRCGVRIVKSMVNKALCGRE